MAKEIFDDYILHYYFLLIWTIWNLVSADD